MRTAAQETEAGRRDCEVAGRGHISLPDESSLSRKAPDLVTVRLNLPLSWVRLVGSWQSRVLSHTAAAVSGARGVYDVECVYALPFTPPASCWGDLCYHLHFTGEKTGSRGG